VSDGAYTITLNHEQGLVHVVAQGNFNLPLGDQMITAAREQAAQNRYKIMCDVRESRTRVTMADWFNLPRRLAAYRKMETRNIKTALLVTPGRQEDLYRFVETVMGNMGLRIRVFLDLEDALEWLEIGPG